VLKENIGNEIQISYSRDQQAKTAIGKCEEDSCILGIAFITSGTLQLQTIKYPVHKAI